MSSPTSPPEMAETSKEIPYHYRMAECQWVEFLGNAF